MKFVLSGLLLALPLAAQTTTPAPAAPLSTSDADRREAPPLAFPTNTTNPAPGPRAAPGTPDLVPPAASTGANPPPPKANFAPGINTTLQPDPFKDPLIVQVVARHEKAVQGDKNETKALTADLERWTKDEPANYLLLAYLGSAYTLDSRDAWPGPGKINFLRKGGQSLDTAVAGDPSNPAVRFVRAINYFELPAIFGKHRTANDDFHVLVQQLNGLLPMTYTLQTDTAQAIYYYAGLSDVQFGQRALARDTWTRGAALAPGSALGQKMKAALAKLR